MLRDRITALTPRERVFLGMGAATVLIFILYLLLPGGEEPAVELTGTPPATAPVIEPALPPPPPMVSTPVPVVSAQAASPVDPGTLGAIVLRGVMGGGPSGGAAIFDTPGGNQRVVRIGREIAPGTVLREVGLRHAIASSGAGDVRLELGKAGAQAVVAAGPAQYAVPTSTPAAQSPGRETLQFRLGLQPVKRGGRVSGYTVKPGAKLPYLGAAGVQPGDVLLSVNGSELDEERLAELSWEIANAGRTEIEFMRGGKRMKASIGGR